MYSNNLTCKHLAAKTINCLSKRPTFKEALLQIFILHLAVVTSTIHLHAYYTAGGLYCKRSNHDQCFTFKKTMFKFTAIMTWTFWTPLKGMKGCHNQSETLVAASHLYTEADVLCILTFSLYILNIMLIPLNHFIQYTALIDQFQHTKLSQWLGQEMNTKYNTYYLLCIATHTSEE